MTQNRAEAISLAMKAVQKFKMSLQTLHLTMLFFDQLRCKPET